MIRIVQLCIIFRVPNVRLKLNNILCERHNERGSVTHSDTASVIHIC